MTFLLFTLLIASVAFNVLLVLYIRHVMSRSSLIRDVTTNMLETLNEFLVHLDGVHELTLFYGDETMKSLLQHSKDLAEDMKEYRDGFIMSPEGEQLDSEPTEEEGTPEAE